MNYGDKRDYKKIDLFRNNDYICSTTWSKTCKEAKERYLLKNIQENPETICARFSMKQ